MELLPSLLFTGAGNARTQSRNLSLVEEKHASCNNTLIGLSNKYVQNMMRTLERKRVSWGQALWRKDKESGLTDFCATYQSLMAGELISEMANDVLLPGLIALCVRHQIP